MQLFSQILNFFENVTLFVEFSRLFSPSTITWKCQVLKIDVFVIMFFYFIFASQIDIFCDNDTLSKYTFSCTSRIRFVLFLSYVHRTESLLASGAVRSGCPSILDSSLLQVSDLGIQYYLEDTLQNYFFNYLKKINKHWLLLCWENDNIKWFLFLW